MESTINFSDYRIEHEGVVICEPCLAISLFSDLDLRSPGSPNELGPYTAFLSIFADALKFCRLDGDQVHFKKTSADLLEFLPRQMRDDKRRKKGGITAEFHSGNTRSEYRAPSFEFRYSHIELPHTAARALFPLSWYEKNGVSGVQAYLEQALGEFSLQAGYVGYCFQWDMNLESLIEPHLFWWLQRHPGIMEPMFSHGSVSHHGLTDLGWITLLGKKYVDQMGGAESLKSATSHIQNVRHFDLPSGGLGIQLGDRPRLGDMAKGDPMNDYRALGKVLAPLRNRQALHEGMAVAGFDDNEHPGLREKWIDRFFPE
jgi:hypothetical protein